MAVDRDCMYLGSTGPGGDGQKPGGTDTRGWAEAWLQMWTEEDGRVDGRRVGRQPYVGGSEAERQSYRMSVK